MTAGCSSIKPVFECQEHLVTTRTKDLMDHTPMNAYILNSYALHNYRWIAAAVPPAVRAQHSAPLVLNHESVRLQAAKVARSKKAAEGADGLVNSTEATQDSGAPSQPPAFDQTKKTRGKGKAKATATAAPIKPTVPVPLSSGSQSQRTEGFAPTQHQDNHQQPPPLSSFQNGQSHYRPLMYWSMPGAHTYYGAPLHHPHTPPQNNQIPNFHAPPSHLQGFHPQYFHGHAPPQHVGYFPSGGSSTGEHQLPHAETSNSRSSNV